MGFGMDNPSISDVFVCSCTAMAELNACTFVEVEIGKFNRC